MDTHEDSNRVSLSEYALKLALFNLNSTVTELFEESYRISLSEDTSQSAYTFSTQTKMNENIPSLDSALYMVAKAQYKQKTSNCLVTSQHQDLAKGLKVSIPGGA